RVMTVHAAKGLEFPVVVLTGFGRKPLEDRSPLAADRESGRVELRLAAGFVTSGWEALATREAELQEAERRRLLYVALTRARDHLIISRFRCAAGGDRTEAHALAERLATVGAIPELPTEIVRIPSSLTPSAAEI